METQNTPTSSKGSSNLIAWVRVILALSLLVGGTFFILRDKKTDSSPSTPSQKESDVKEPENPLAKEPAPSEPETAALSSATTVYYVSPLGSDTNDGRAVNTPFQTIQKAIDLAQPGETIELALGTYRESFVSKRDGKSDKRITIHGSPQAIIEGSSDGEGRIIEIHHDYLTLDGFTVDGLSGDPKKAKGYRDKLLYLQGTKSKAGVKGVRLTHLTIENAGGECVRLRYYAEENEIAYNTIKNCGRFDFLLEGDGKNGEGIYIGTAPEQRDDGKNPTKDIDISRANWIHNNTIDTEGNECVDIKEGATENIVENNTCTGQKDPESGGMDSRGNKNVFRHNDIFGNKGAGIRLGGDKKDNGINNFVYNNTIHDNANGGIKLMRLPQAKICGNTFSNNKDGNFVGEDSDYKKDDAC